MIRHQPLPELLVVGLICAGFGASMLAYRALFPDHFDFLTTDELLLGFFTSAFAFRLAILVTESDVKNPWLRLFDEFRIGTGINLITQALLNYLDILTRSMFLIVIGGMFAASLLAIARRFFPARDDKVQTGTVMVGFDRSSAEMAPLLPYPLVGLVGGQSYFPGTPTVDYSQFETSMAQWQPKQIVVTAEGAARIDPSALLTLRLNGASVNSTCELYESLLGRVSCAGREPVDLLLSEAQSGNSQAMAFQAIYTNLIGLILLIAASPLIAVTTVAIALFSGPGPIIEMEGRSGFRNIPFQRMRFRTRRTDGTLAYTRIGSLISRLRLADLPLLFNIVRGEMALFGPRPVRREFASRLTEIMPFYSMRFAVKPGIINWGAVQSSRYQDCACVLTEIEYDLYYVKHGSPLLDFEILMRLIFGGNRSQDSPAEFAQAAR
jgi:lipopolysaccharide/colanic/teichoic acid biosynthesis glycosyltransferase